jgi:DNA helicase HerA-like ATPase
MVSLVIGKSGSGKTYFIKNELLNNVKNFIVFDVNGEYETDYIVESHSDFIKNISVKGSIALRYDVFEEYFDTLNFLYRNTNNFNLVIDELGLYVNTKKDNEDLRNMIILHRHKKIDLLVATQSPHLVTNFLVAQTSKYFIFHLSPMFAEKLAEKIDLSDEDIGKINNLKVGEHLKIFSNMNKKINTAETPVDE